MASTPVRRKVTPALGIDVSTHAVHMALVGRDAVLATAIVDLDRRPLSGQVSKLTTALRSLNREKGMLALVEAPYLGANAASTIKLARMVGIVETVATIEGYWTRTMSAAEWRPMAGITAGDGVKRKLRSQLKSEALRLVKMEFGLDCGKDDNLAEAILIGRVAFGLQSREAALA